MSVNNTDFIIESLNHAKILNGLLRKGIRVKKCKKQLRRLSITVESKQAGEAKVFFEEYGYNHIIAAEKGIKHTADRFFRRYGLLAGILIAVAVLILASNFIFEIEINGLSRISAEAVEEALTAEGVVSFCSKNTINIPAIQNEINSIEGVASVSVVIKGMKLIIEIAEELPQGEVPDYGFDGLYALNDTIITRVVVQSGTAMVKAGDTVKAGALLIAPFYQLTEDNLTPVPARGEVFGRTYIKEDLIFATERIEKIPTGKTKTTSELYFGNALIGKRAICPFAAATECIDTVQLGPVLPFKAVYHTYNEVAETLVLHDYNVESPALILEKQNEIEAKIEPSKVIVSKWNISKNIDKIYIISIYYELEGRVDARLPKEN